MNASDNIDKLNQELSDVSEIMTKSFDMLLNRDRNINQLTDKAQDLRDSAKGFKDSS